MLTILKAARERPELRVVNDQFGAPTSSAAIADATLRALEKGGGEGGVYHMSSGGRTSWHGFAQAIVQGAGLTTPVKAIPTSEYPAPARRPRNSLLDNHRLRKDFGIVLPDWTSGLEAALRRVQEADFD
jgi:dTDP-4-dehydrorhamnose reductase